MAFNLKSKGFVLLILLLPLLIINVKTSHDWGDDFAQYLIQARNIVEHRPQTDNGLLQNKDDHAFAIGAYPAGFPLLLSPVYYFFGLKILPYCILNSVFLILSGIIIFRFFRLRFPIFISLLAVLLFCYNPVILELKKQILTETVFNFFCIFIIYLSERNNQKTKKDYLLIIVLLAFLASIRLAGIAMIAAFIIAEILTSFKNRDKGKAIRFTLTAIPGIILCFFLLNRYLFNSGTTDLLKFYYEAFLKYDIKAGINLKFNYSITTYFLPFMNGFISSAWVLLSAGGWILSIRKKQNLTAIFFPVYILMICFYPYSDGGLRFLLPVFILLIYYAIIFLEWFFIFLNYRFAIIVGLMLFLITGYIRPVTNIIKSTHSIEEGPQTPEAVQMFNYIKSSTPLNSAIVFCRARAMSLYSSRSSLYLGKNQSDEESVKQFSRYSFLYIVIGKAEPGDALYDPALLHIIATYPERFEKVWNNKIFNIYQQK